MIEFKTAMQKQELYELAEENGVEVQEEMTKNDIIVALNTYNDSLSDGESQDPEAPPESDPEQTPDPEPEPEPETNTEPPLPQREGQKFIYVGPTVGRYGLRENAVFHGTFEQVREHLSIVLEAIPQVEKQIVPSTAKTTTSSRVKKRDTLQYKQYQEIASLAKNKR